MKHIFLTLIAFIIAINAFSQKNVVKTTPLGFVYGRYNLQYEKILTDYTSASISASYLKPNLLGFDNLIQDFLLIDIKDDWSFNGVAIHFDYRLYSKNKPGPQGFYVAPYIRYAGIDLRADLNFSDINNYTGSEEKPDISGIKTGFTANRFGYGVKIGAQWIIKDLISIDWNFGGLGADLYRFSTFDYTYKDEKYEQEIITDYLWRFAFATNLTVGYAF